MFKKFICLVLAGVCTQVNAATPSLEVELQSKLAAMIKAVQKEFLSGKDFTAFAGFYVVVPQIVVEHDSSSEPNGNLTPISERELGVVINNAFLKIKDKHAQAFALAHELGHGFTEKLVQDMNCRDVHGSATEVIADLGAVKILQATGVGFDAIDRAVSNWRSSRIFDEKKSGDHPAGDDRQRLIHAFIVSLKQGRPYLEQLTQTLRIELNANCSGPSKASRAAEPETKLTDDDVKALKVIASRKGLVRLDYNKGAHAWGLVDLAALSASSRASASKNRFDMIEPLENLVARMEKGYWQSVSKDAELIHLFRSAYASLSSLYSYYKIHPDANSARQNDFVWRFAMVLARLKAMVIEIENRLGVAKAYKPMPHFGDVGKDLREADLKRGFRYLEMSTPRVAELNASLRRVGNNYTKIGRAMEFYPAWELPQKAQGTVMAKRTVIFVVADARDFAENDLLIEQTKYMAQTFANEEEAPIEVYTFDWNGAPENEDEMIAGEELASLVRTYFPPEDYKDIYVGHAQGGNVILHAAKTLREYRTPYMIVSLETPIPPDFITDNVNYLIEFYTRGQGGGFMRLDIENVGLFAHNDRFNKVKIYTVNTSLSWADGAKKATATPDIRYIIGSLPHIIYSVFAFMPDTRLALQLNLDQFNQPKVELRLER